MIEAFIRNFRFPQLIFAVVVMFFIGLAINSFIVPEPVSISGATSNYVSGGTNTKDQLSESDPMLRKSNNLAEQKDRLNEELKLAGAEMSKMQNQLATIVSDLERIKDNAAGRKIVSDQEQIGNLIALIRYIPAMQKKDEMLGDRMARIKLNASLFDSVLKFETSRENLAFLMAELESNEKELSNISLAIRAIESVSQGLPASSKSVRNRIDEIDEQEALIIASRLKSAQSLAIEKRGSLLVEAQREREEALLALEEASTRMDSSLLLEKAAEKNQTLALELAKRKLAAEKVKLEFDFQNDLTNIRHYLAPLIADGYSQPHYTGSHKTTFVKGPFSLTALRSVGALEESIEGISCLGSTICGSGNDRGKFSCPSFSDPIVLPYLRTTQTLLLKYKYLLVEKRCWPNSRIRLCQ